MPRLEEAVKTFIVERLAQYARPTEVVDAVKEEFAVTITRQAVEEYDPEKRCTTQKWVDLHRVTRAAFLERKAGLAISHRSWRLQQLEEMARAARKSRNYKLASSLLEQAAKEEGDFYVNSRAGGAGAGDLSEDERVERMRQQVLAMDEATRGPAPTGPANGPSLVKSA
jgi:hypothetical protein